MKIETHSGREPAFPASEARILFVTILPAEVARTVLSRFGDDIRVVDYDQVTAELLESFKPHFVVSTILTPRFDIIDLAQLLTRLKFTGAYRVLTDEALPNPGVVLREVRSHCPKLDVDLLSLDMLRR